MSSDNDFFVLRKFGKLNARVALMMQDRISHLEEELDFLDEECRLLGVNNGTFRHDKNERRQQILEQLARKLERYSTEDRHTALCESANLVHRYVRPLSLRAESAARCYTPSSSKCQELA